MNKNNLFAFLIKSVTLESALSYLVINIGISLAQAFLDPGQKPGTITKNTAKLTQRLPIINTASYSTLQDSFNSEIKNY